jgi:hypothetical protein
MKFIKYSLGMLVTMLVFITSCTDFVEPRIPYSTFDTGAYLRTTARTSTSFNFFDLANSKFDITVEAVDAENGTTVDNVEVRVRRRRLIPGVGLQFVPAAGPGGAVNDVLLKTIPGSAFTLTPDSKFLRTQIVVTAPEALSALGLTAAQVNGGDVFEIRLKLTDKKGRVFNDVNASADIKGGLFYASPFLYNVGVVCPSDLGGTYDFVQVDQTSPYGTCPGNTFSGKITWTPIAGTTSYAISDVSYGMLGCQGTPTAGAGVRINDACGLLSYSGADGFGGVYTFNFVSNNGTDLVFTWTNNFGESGRVTVKSNPGKPWPAGLR